jgi:phenylalanyl-tRNA synthetase beta subunit
LRTDAAARFEKGVDISQTAAVLKRAANLIKTLAGGNITGKVVMCILIHRQKSSLPSNIITLKS